MMVAGGDVLEIRLGIPGQGVVHAAGVLHAMVFDFPEPNPPLPR